MVASVIIDTIYLFNIAINIIYHTYLKQAAIINIQYFSFIMYSICLLMKPQLSYTIFLI